MSAQPDEAHHCCEMPCALMPPGEPAAAPVLADLPPAAWARIAQLLPSLRDLFALYTSSKQATAGLDAVPGLWRECSQRCIGWAAASDESTRSALVAAASIAAHAAGTGHRALTYTLPSWARVQHGTAKDLQQLEPGQLRPPLLLRGSDAYLLSLGHPGGECRAAGLGCG